MKNLFYEMRDFLFYKDQTQREIVWDRNDDGSHSTEHKGMHLSVKMNNQPNLGGLWTMCDSSGYQWDYGYCSDITEGKRKAILSAENQTSLGHLYI